MAKQNSNNNQNVQQATAELRDFNQESTALVVTLQDLAKALRDNAGAASRFTGDSAGAFTAMFKDSVGLAQKMEGYTLNQLKNRKSEAAFLSGISKLEQDRARVQSKIAFLEDKMATSSKAQIKYIQRSLDVLRDVDSTLESQVNKAGELKTKFEEISKAAKPFDDLADFFAEIPGVSKVFGEFQKASDAAREAAAQNGNALKAGAKELGGVFVKSAAAFAISTLIKGLKDADERTVDLGRNLNKSAEESARLVRNFNSAARGIQGLTGADLQKGATLLAESLGTTAVSSMATSKELAAQTKYLGISADEAARQAEFSQATGQDIAKAGNALRGEVMLSNLRNKTGIKYQAIMKDIANTSNATKILMKGQGINITQAAIEAKKLGTTLEGIGRTSASMLDFESSIANELEAELLTGKELNNEKARAAALRGDELTVAQEIKKNGVLEKFAAAKTVLERDAIAKAYGQTAETMGDMVTKSKAISAMGAKDEKDLAKKYSAQLKQIELLKAQGKLAEASNLEATLSNQIGNEELERQMKNQTFEEKKQEAMTKLAEAMDKMLPIIKAVAKVFEVIGAHAQTIAKALLLIAGASMLSKLGRLAGVFGKLGGSMSSAAGEAGGLVKSATSSTGFRNAAGQFAKAPVTEAAEKGGGGLLGKMGGFFKGIGGKIADSGIGKFVGNAAGKAGGMLSKLNPLKAAGSWLGKNASKVLKLPVISSAIELFFAKGDIEDMIANATDKKSLYQQVGKRSWEALGSIGGAALGSLIPIPGIGTMLGGMAGGWLAGILADKIGAEGMGKFVVDDIFPSAKKNSPIPLATGGITQGPTHALVGEAGPEAVIPLREFYAKIDELIAAVKQGHNIYLGTNKLNETMGLHLHPMR